MEIIKITSEINEIGKNTKEKIKNSYNSSFEKTFAGKFQNKIDMITTVDADN